MQKLTFLSLLIVFLLACKKKDGNNVSPTNTDKATLKVEIVKNDSMKITVHYTENNTGTYLDDLLKVYYNDTFASGITIDPKGTNSDYVFMSYRKYSGNKYRVELIREITSGNKVTIATTSGN